jgi:hypothetical protein
LTAYIVFSKQALLQKTLNIIAGFLLGLTPLVAAAFLGLFFYSAFPNIFGLLVLSTALLLAIWLGVSIFKRIQMVGLLEFITALHASPEADNLEPSPDGETKKRTPAQLADLINRNENLLKDGSLRIFGDWFGKPFEKKLTLTNAQFNQDSNILTLIFSGREKLEVFNPMHILEASTFLKIIDAERVKLSFYNLESHKSEKISFFLDYRKKNKKIATNTNVDWSNPVFDVSVSAPALMIFG